MAVTDDVEIIDLTGSAPQSPPLSAASTHFRSLRKQKRARTETDPNEGIAKAPLHTPDGDEAPSPMQSYGSGKRPKSRKKKRAVKPMQECEVADDAEDGDATELASGAQSNVDGDSENAQALCTDTKPRTNGSSGRRNPSPPFYLDNKPDTQVERRLDLGNDSNSEATINIAISNTLLLPEHVVLDLTQGNYAPLETDASAMVDTDTDDFIHYADAELNLFTRYYEEPKGDNDRKALLVCGQCGTEGDHKQADCPVVVCLTCGAHNEHSTRQCRIVKTCFTCGMKGHINKDCPNKNASRRMINRDYDCGRCGSVLHNARECPILWRIYDYVDDGERETTLKLRGEKENLPIGQGGEGYIGEDYWCYNCGGSGHSGDDCQVEPRNPDAKEPIFNTMPGPFADKVHVRSGGREFRREWELNGNFDDGHGFTGPSNVGKRGRDKERDRLRRREKYAREVEDDNDNDNDWFGSRLQTSSRLRLLQSTKRKESDEKIVFNLQGGRRTDKVTRRPADRLLDRLSSGRVKEEAGQDRAHGRRSASPRDRRRSRSHRYDGGSKRDPGREPYRERERRVRDRNEDRERDGERERERERYYQSSGGDPNWQGAEDKERGQDRTSRQYYGNYVR